MFYKLCRRIINKLSIQTLDIQLNKCTFFQTLFLTAGLRLYEVCTRHLRQSSNRHQPSPRPGITLHRPNSKFHRQLINTTFEGSRTSSQPLKRSHLPLRTRPLYNNNSSNNNNHQVVINVCWTLSGECTTVRQSGWTRAIMYKSLETFIIIHWY